LDLRNTRIDAINLGLELKLGLAQVCPLLRDSGVSDAEFFLPFLYLV
jgi:hypothetical protein